MKRTILLIVIFLTTAGFSAAQTNVSIGAWNIQWLGSPAQRSGCGKNIRQMPADIADYIAASRVDVLAFEEIGDTDGASQTRTNNTLDSAFAILNETGGNRWKYLLFAKRSQSQTTQLVGVAWNERNVQKVGNPLRLQMTTTNSSDWDRWATAIKFKFGSNKTDIVVIPVHMKANFQGNFSAQREREAQALINAMNSVRTEFNDQDIIVIGDTNILTRTEGAVTKFRNGGFVDLNNDDDATMVEGSAPFDRAFIPQNQSEFSIASQDVFEMAGITKEEFRAKFSDHYMIRFVVRVINDDD